jgi:hypothetical protein
MTHAGMSRPFYGSFRRALDSDQVVSVSKRRLQGLDELEKYYPFKTRDALVKSTREALLPVLCKHLSDTKERQFSLSDNEEYLLGLLSQEVRRHLKTSWQKIETEVIRAMYRHVRNSDCRDRLLDLLARGRELFSPGSGISHGRAFGNLLVEAVEVAGPLTVLVAARDLYVGALPKEARRRTVLKSQLFAVMDFGAQGASGMKDETKQVLLKAAPQIVKGLPGHVDGSGQGWDHRLTHFSPVLDRLIGRDVLAPFEFVSLGAD